MIISPINNHANRLYSHRSAWGRMWGNCLGVPMGFNSDWSNEDVVYLEHGMEWKVGAKSINYFLASEKQLRELTYENSQRVLVGKPPKASSWEKLAIKARMFESFKGKLYSLDVDCPLYGTLLKTRIRDWVPDEFKNLDFDRIDEVCKKALTVKQPELFGRLGLTLGDSHALSAWNDCGYLCRNDGQTLNGALTRGFSTWIDEFTQSVSTLKFLRTYFGNIDIRHHICRLSTDPAEQIKTTKDLVKRYFKELLAVKQKYSIEIIEVVGAIAIEDISRKLPKTGYYKGQPFWGSWDERDAVYREFNRIAQGLCERLEGFEFVSWPNNFINKAGQLDMQYMERPQSVHISPEHYVWSI